MGSILRRARAAMPPDGLDFLWASRRRVAGEGIFWDIGQGPAPHWPEGGVLLHLAGTTGANRPEVNTELIAPLAEACAQNAVRHIIFLSSAAVYAPGPAPVSECAAPAPVSAYGAAKLAAEDLLRDAATAPLSILRLGNLAGADALLSPVGAADVIRLDPVPGCSAGPLRSWIGPLTFADTLVSLIRRIAAGEALPPLLNLAQSPPLGMAGLLAASGRAWEWGPYNPRVVPAAVLDTTRLASILTLPEASPDQIIAEVNAVAPVSPERQAGRV